MANSVVWDNSLSKYKIFGSQTPPAFSDKRRLVPDDQIESIAAVFIDVLRATTTLVAVGAAGANGIFVDVKPKLGDYPFEPPSSLSDLGPWIYGGELNGSAVTGISASGTPVQGVIGNSPTDARRDVFHRQYLRFFSTNGSMILQAVIDGGMPVICAMSIANVEATVEYILSTAPDRVWLTCGGFYGAATLEDSVAAGLAIELLIERGYATEDQLDDEARSMLMQGRYFTSVEGILLKEELVQKLNLAQVGQLLIGVGRKDDIRAAITGEGIEEVVRDAMIATVLRVVPGHGPLLAPVGGM